MFRRSNDVAYPAQVSAFRLDQYEVTVGRFRGFVAAARKGWLPPAGSGKHVHLNGGKGLSGSDVGTFESGWDSTWDVRLPSSTEGWNALLGCDEFYQTWTETPGARETWPIGCVPWYPAYAFCIWDGGFLPSEAEWNYATAGGSEQREYAWGSTAPEANTTLAIYGCNLNGAGTCTGVTNIAPVGSVTAGNGRYGQADLAGNIWEWTLDWSGTYPSTCVDCMNTIFSARRAVRGGGFTDPEPLMHSSFRNQIMPNAVAYDIGFRCARSP